MIIREYRIYDKSISDFKYVRHYNQYHDLNHNDICYYKYSYKEKVYAISRCKIDNNIPMFEGILIRKIYDQ